MNFSLPFRGSGVRGGYFGVRTFHTTNTLFERRAIMGQKILSKVPKFLVPYTVGFIKRPVANLTSFLILHEISAIVPLIGFWYLFHKYQFSIPLDLPQWAISKGTKIIDDSLQSFNFEGYSLHDKFNLILEGAYAFVLVKMLLPVRLAFSFALTPSFTKYIIEPILRVFKRKPAPEIEKIEKQAVKKVDKPRL